MNRLRKYKLFLDKTYLSSIKNDEILEFELPAGHHVIKAQMLEWCGSREIHIDLIEGETCYIKLSAFEGAKIVYPLAAMLAIIGFILMQGENKLFGLLAIPIMAVMIYYFTIGREKYLSLWREMQT
jgi:hypothetical protein